MIDIDFFDQLDRFTFMVRKRVSTLYKGTRRSVRYGKGTELVGFREYTRGDDIRLIDWKVYARTDKLFIREFEEEKSAITHILLDSSRSMDFGRPYTKFEYGAMLGAGIAYLVVKNSEKFAFSTFSERIAINPPRKSLSSIVSIVDELERMEIKGKTKLLRAIEEFTDVLRTRSVVVLISDFLVKPEEVRRALMRIGRHEIIMIQVLSDIEWELDVYGSVEFIDSETGDKIEVYATPSFLEEYKRRLENHIEETEKIAREVGADFFSFRTDMPVFESMLEVIEKSRY